MHLEVVPLGEEACCNVDCMQAGSTNYARLSRQLKYYVSTGVEACDPQIADQIKVLVSTTVNIW